MINLFTPLHKPRLPTHSKGPLLRAFLWPTVALPPLVSSSSNVLVASPKAAGPFPRSRLALCRLSADTHKLGLGCWGF